MKSFLRLIRYIGNYWEKAVLNALFNITSILFSVVSITMIAPFLRLLFGNQPLVHEEPVLELGVSSAIHYFNYLLSKVIIEYGQVEGLLFITSDTAVFDTPAILAVSCIVAFDPIILRFYISKSVYKPVY